MSVLARAELLLQAKNYLGSGSWLDEANAHDAVNNGALFLPWTGQQHLHLPGITANYVSAGDSAALDLTGDFSIRAHIGPDDWTPGSLFYICAKAPASVVSGYVFRVTTAGKLEILLGDGAFRAATSSVATGVTDGTNKYVRVDWDASLDDVTFFTSDDGVSWTQLGTVRAVSSTGPIAVNANALSIGVFSSGGLGSMTGRFYRLQIYSDITETTLAFDADFTDVAALTEPFATFVEKSSNAATVTINRASSGRVSTVVDRPMFLFGTNDYFEIPDDAGLNFAAGDDLTVMVAGRLNEASAGQGLATKKTISTSPAGWVLTTFAGNFWSNVADGTVGSSETIPEAALQTAFVAAFIRNTTDDDLEVFKDGSGSGSPTTDATTATLANANAVFIGASVGPIQFLDGEIHAVAIWREALSDIDVVLADVELLSIHSDELMMLGVG